MIANTFNNIIYIITINTNIIIGIMIILNMNTTIIVAMDIINTSKHICLTINEYDYCGQSTN